MQDALKNTDFNMMTCFGASDHMACCPKSIDSSFFTILRLHLL